jgi:hypothetical protein
VLVDVSSLDKAIHFPSDEPVTSEPRRNYNLSYLSTNLLVQGDVVSMQVSIVLQKHALDAMPIDVHGGAMHGLPSGIVTEPLAMSPSASLSFPASNHGLQPGTPPGQPASPPAAPSAETPPAGPRVEVQHTMIMRHRDQTCREKMYTDGTVRYDPRRRGFFAAPTSHREALLGPACYSSMSDEFAALHQTVTWTLVPRPPGVHIVGSKWIFKTKHPPDGSIDKHKACLVARGFT